MQQTTTVSREYTELRPAVDSLKIASVFQNIRLMGLYAFHLTMPRPYLLVERITYSALALHCDEVDLGAPPCAAAHRGPARNYT